MASPDFFGEPRTPRLSNLLREINQGQIQVPRFQRPFVWTDEQRLALLESVYLGYPIGSLLVWRTQTHHLATYDYLGPARLPKPDDGLVHQYLLDGHQRLTTLFSALGRGLYDERGEVTWTDDAREDEVPVWRVYFDLGAGRTDNPFKLHPRRGQVNELWLPLALLYDSYALGEFMDGLRRAGHPRALVNRAQAVADIFKDYALPVIPIVTEDLAQATTSFKRVNSGGTKMSEVHMLNALTWQPNFDLRARLAKISASLSECGWSGLDPKMILDVCKAALAFDIHHGNPEALARTLSSHPEYLETARDNIRRAADILHEIAGICGPGVVPYSYQAVLLADALGTVPERLDERVRAHVRDWFWATTFTEYFRGVTGSVFRKAREHLHGVVQGALDDPMPPDIDRSIAAHTRFDFRSARSKAMALLLAANNPPQLDDDPVDRLGLLGFWKLDDIPALDELYTPQNLLADHGAAVMPRLIANDEVASEHRELLRGPGNRFIVRPRRARELRSFLLNEADQDFADRHAVSPRALQALRGDELVEFVRARRDTLMDMEQHKAESLGLEYRR